MNKNNNASGDEPQDEPPKSRPVKKWLPGFALNHSKEILSAVVIGVLVTLISTIIIDKLFYTDVGPAASIPGRQYPVNYQKTQINSRLYYMRANLASILSALGIAKAYLAEYYMMRGEFPVNSEEFDISMLDLDEREFIAGAYLIEEGGIGVSLSEDFGEDKHLVLLPSVSTNSAFIKWRCETNVDEKYLGMMQRLCNHQDDL